MERGACFPIGACAISITMNLSARLSEAAAHVPVPELQHEVSLGDIEPTALELLLHRMRASSDFPSLSSAVTRIQRIAASDTESLASLASEILKDVALTQRLLRMVNTVYYSRPGGGGISTVSRAVALVGFAGIRNMALSLVLLEGMQDQAQAGRLREEFVRSLLAGQLASELTPGDTDAEEAYLAALFHNLGHLMTEIYLPEEAAAIRKLSQGAGGRPAEMSAEAAVRQVLGLGLEALGVGVAKSWGLPDSLRSALRRPVGAAPTRAVPRGTERNRWLAALANDVALAMQLKDPEAARQQLRRLAEQHARVLDVSAAEICAAAEQARHTVAQLAPAIGLVVQPGTATHRLLTFSSSGAPALAPGDVRAAAAGAGAGAGAAAAAGPGVLDAASAGASEGTASAAAEMLAAGIQDVMSTLSSDAFQLNAVLRMILETLLRALHLRRVVFCLRDPRTQLITGRFGLGDDVDSVLRKFSIATKPVAGTAIDLFSAVCLKAVDTLIADATGGPIRQRLPAWYGPEVASPSFLLLPLAMKGATFGLIYADTHLVGGLALPERDMALVRTLRNQAVMAFRQAS